MDLFDQDYRPPESSPADTSHAVVRAVLSSLPVVGSGLSAVFEAIFVPPLRRRTDEWAQEIGVGLRRLEAKGFDIATLAGDPAFLDVAGQATAAVLRTSQQLKREALRCAVLNATSPPRGLELQERTMFVALVDVFNEWHLRLLDFAKSPEAWQAAAREAEREQGLGHPASHFGDFEDLVPEARGRIDFFKQMWAELNSRGLINTPDMNVVVRSGGKRTTPLGDRFLAFISAPPD
jgi:hypothetical protein